MSENNTEELKSSRHRILCASRSQVEITEVTGVVAFDEEEIVLETGGGKMRIVGDGLRITVLSLETGVVSAVGKIDGFSYLDDGTEKRSRFFSRRG